MKEQVHWLTYLRVGIDYICKFVQYLCPWWILDKNKNNKKWDKINEINLFLIEIQNKMNNKYLMYVQFFFGDTPI